MTPEGVLFVRDLCFSVMGIGGDGWAVLTVLRLKVCLGLRVPFLRLSHLKKAPDQEVGRQGYSLETGRTSGALEDNLESAHTEGPGRLRQ